MFDSIIEFFSNGYINIILAFVIAYLLGSLNFSIIITGIVQKGKDIRTMGSGNAGFTNVLRCVGKGPAIATILLDFAKGVAATLIGGILFSQVTVTGVLPAEVGSYGEYICGFIAILGHMLPAFFKFKGGKGVVCTASLIAVVDFKVLIVLLAVFGIVFAITKIISISSLIGSGLFPIATFLSTYYLDYIPSLSNETSYSPAYVIVATLFAVFVTSFVFIKHKENIKRLRNGTEKKLTVKKDK